MTDFWLSASETNEDGERVAAAKIIAEIHDSMCCCKCDPGICDTPGISGTLIQAASALLSEGKWHEYFEDGWISVEAYHG